MTASRSARGRRGSKVAVLVAGSLAVTACSSEHTQSAPSVASPPTVTQPASQPQQSAQPAALRGIITAACSDSGSEQLTAYDPGGGLGGSRVFSLNRQYTVSFDCLSNVPYGQILRQQFNADFTRMAVATGDTSTDTSIAGYLQYGPGGQTTFVSLGQSSATGYGTTKPQQYAAVFQPGTGRLWYTTPDSLESVDPATPGQPRKENIAAPIAFAGFLSSFAFTPDGKLPLGTGAFAYNSYTRDGMVISYASQGLGTYGYGPETRQNSDLDLIAFDGQLCWPQAFINGQTFLCIDTDRTQLYTMTVSSDHKRLTQKALLPQSDKQVSGVVADPTGQAVAFIADGGGGDINLYRVPIGGGEPTQISNVPDGTRLVDWVG